MTNYMKTADVIKWLKTSNTLHEPIFPKRIDLSKETMTTDEVRELCDLQYTPMGSLQGLGLNLFREMECDVITFVILHREDEMI